MDLITNSKSVVELIQLSLAPVFLLVGIGQMLNVATGRLARIIDRARWYDAKRETGEITVFTAKQCNELIALRRRMRFANWSINFLTAAALLVCITVVLLIINGIVDNQLESYVLWTFGLSMASITGGLLSFFAEVGIASATLKIPQPDNCD